MNIKNRMRFMAILGMLVGLLSVVAASRVLLGSMQPSYVVLPALVIYNLAMGVVSLVAGLGLYANRLWAGKLSSFIAAGHLIVLLTLTALYLAKHAVATESLGAMVFRSAVWLGIAVAAMKTNKAMFRQPQD